MLGHSAGEMAASYIAGALSLEDAVRVTFHRSRLQHRTAGQGAMLAVGMSREEAARLVERYPRAISIAAINGPEFGHALGRCRGARRDRQGAQRRGCVQPRLAGGRALSQPQDGAARNGAVGMPARYPAAAGIDAVLLHGDRHRAARDPSWMRGIGTGTSGSRCFSTTPWQDVIDAGHRVFLEIGAHPILRHDIAAVLEREVSRQGTTLCSLRRDDRERAALLGSLGRMYTLGAEIDWRKLYPAEATADQAAELSVPGGESLAGIRDDASDRAWAVRCIRCWEIGSRHRSRPGAGPGYGELELSVGPSDRRLDRLSGRRICRDGARGGPRNFRAGSLRRWRTSNSRSS